VVEAMSTSHREELIDMIRRFSDEQIEALFGVARRIDGTEREPYDPSQDGTIGSIDGLPEDFAERSEEILEELTRKRGAWTQKDDN
jgi:hypothetical protein